MLASSESLEEFHDRVRRLDAELTKSQSKPIRKPELLQDLASLARDWLRISAALKNDAAGFLPSLDPYDVAMSEILACTKQQARATSYKAKLKIFKDDFLDKIVIQIMRFEGSPSQAAARLLESSFANCINDSEAQYISEAARCSAQKCHRASIILLWAAAISRMHSEIEKIGFTAFNVAATETSAVKGAPFNRVSKNLSIGSLAELQRGRDFDIIAVGMTIWGYDLQAFEELDRLLGIRNSAAHPGMFAPNSLEVAQFAEKLKRFVFEKVGTPTI